MDTRTELVRLAQAGDHSAAQSLIEQSYPILYRLALSVLADPHDAAEAAREAGINLLENIQDYPGPSAHSAWLYSTTLAVCQEHLRRARLFQRLPESLRRLLRLQRSTSQTPAGNPGLPERSWTLLREIYSLEQNLRLVVVLRYAHDLLPHEIAQVLNWRESSAQARLQAAREHLARPYRQADPSELEAGPEEGLTHAQAEHLIESAADFRVTDEEALLLKRHLKSCPRCAQAAARLAAFENELRSALHLRWDAEAAPLPGLAASVFDHRRRRIGIRHSLNLAGGIAVAGLVVAMVMWLPANSGLQIIPAAPQPLATTTRAELEPTQAPPRRNRAFLPTPNPEITRQPDPTRIVENRSLLSSIYPGKLAYIAFNELSDHLFTLQPGRRVVDKLTTGFTENSAPAWSPDGSQIAYLSVPQGWGLNAVYVMNADGSGNRQVSGDYFPVPPDTSAETSDTQVVHYPLYGPPHWSADGKQLASGIWVDAAHHYLAILSLSDAPAHYLAAEGLERELIAWSPDGSAILYASQYGQELWLYEPDQPERAGQNPRKLYGKGSWDMLFGLAWSPDSGRIAVISGRRQFDIVQADLRIMRKFGVESEYTTISSGILTRTPLRNSDLSWLPDGRYLAYIPVFTNNDLVNGQVALFHVGASDPVRTLVQLNKEISGLTWAPNGRWLAFSSGNEVWGASLDAYENEEVPLVRIARSAGSSLSWQPQPVAP